MIRHLVGMCMVGVLALASLSQPADAQQSRRDSAQRGRGAQGGDRKSWDRATMERRFEAQFNEILRTKLRLTDEQVKQLRTVSTRVERQKRELWRSEQVVRAELRKQLLATEPASESRIAELLDSLPRLEHRRIEAMEQEQRELARFLMPSQRARYHALQDELRRGMQELQRGRLGAPGDRGARGAAPGGTGDGSARPPRAAPPRQGPPALRP